MLVRGSEGRGFEKVDSRLRREGSCLCEVAEMWDCLFVV